MRRLLGTPARDYLPALSLWLVTALYLDVASGYKPLVRAFPEGVAWIMLALLSLDLVARTRTRAGRALTRWLNPADTAPTQDTYPAARQLAAVLGVAGFAALIVLVGILGAVPLFVLAAMRLAGGRPYRTCILAAGAATLFIWLLFSVLLRLSLYPGLVFGGA